MSKSFKKFREFISEEKDDSCPRCGEEWAKCSCIEDDYYDAKISHYTPPGDIKKGPHKSQK